MPVAHDRKPFRRHGVITAGCWLLASPLVANANDFYVAPSGSDGNPGTLSQPFRTVQQAASVLQPGDTAWLRAGTYRETVVPAHSGAPGAPITFRSYPGEFAVISGLELVTNWTSYAGSIYKASMPWTQNGGLRWWNVAGGDQVFVDGVMMCEARWPNLPAGVTPATLEKTNLARSESGQVLVSNTNGGPAVARYTLTGLPGDANALKDARILFLCGAHWVPMTGTVTASDTNSVTFSYPFDDNTNASNAYLIEDRDHFFVWGKFSLLDSPSEWFHDTDGTLYLWTPDGSSPGGNLVEARKRDMAFDLRGRSYITLADLNVFAGDLESDTNSHHVTLRGLDVRYVAHGTWVSWWWSSGAWDMSLKLLGSNSVVSDCDIHYSADSTLMVGVHGRMPDATANGDNTVITNNVITDWGYNATGSGIEWAGSNVLISGNVISNSVSWMAINSWKSRSSHILHNDLSEMGKLIWDQAALYVYPAGNLQGTEIGWNRIHDTRGEWDPTRSYNGSDGIYFDAGSSFFTLHHNVVWNTPAMALNLYGVANLLISDFNIYNNTFDSTNVDLLNVQNLKFCNNIVRKWADRGYGAGNGNQVYSNNFENQNSALQCPDPHYVNPALGDFTLTSNSPAIDQGMVIPSYTDGYIGPAPDIGAYEYGKPVWRAGAIVAQRHLYGLYVSWNGTPGSNTLFTVNGLPALRGLGDNFKLQIGTNAAGGTVSLQNGIWIVTNMPGAADLAPGIPVYGQVGDGTPVALGTPLLRISVTNGSVTLGWDGSVAKLQSTATLQGTWTDIAGAVSPYGIDVTNDACFFRTRFQPDQ